MITLTVNGQKNHAVDVIGHAFLWVLRGRPWHGPAPTSAAACP